MNINRDNYEMYFLLYVDNELSAAERNAVERFVEENIDLNLELRLLLDTALPVEELVYSAKNNLYKDEKNTGLLQEKMLLFLDNELDPASAKALETQLENDEAARTDWASLRRTRLDPGEKIIFKNKHLLYHHEEKQIVKMRFWRIAVAAAFVAAGLFIGITFFSKDRSTPAIAINDETQGPAKQHANKIKIPFVKDDKNNLARGVNPGENAISATQKQINIIAGKKKVNPVVQEQNNSEKQVVKKETNNLPKPYFENINKQESNQTIASSVTNKKKEALQKNESLNELVKVTPANKITETLTRVEYSSLTETPVSYAKNAVFEDIAMETNNDRIFYMNEEKVSRSKISGLFRKVKRVIERNTKIKTRNGLKIAGFEFAVR